jgi:CRISPR-associated protein Csm1
MYSQDEKILILGSLFHDIGKFEQRCTGNPEKKTHQIIGGKFADDLKTEFMNILDNNEESFNLMKNIILQHHNKNLNDELVKIVQKADHISAGERVEIESNEEMGEIWSHKYLASLFSKVRLLSDEEINPMYFKQVELTKGRYDAMIPKEKAEAEISKFGNENYKKFFIDLQSVLNFYNTIKDFDTIINLILVLFEKYLWCIPDFTGSSETDISLYNHLKDVCGLSLAIYKSKESEKLNLVIGDLPGIQDYIFGIVNKKPAKILRGRSINVQVLTRNFATKFLNEFGATEANLVMFAGGKFYILAPDNDEFNAKFDKSIKEIEEYLINEYNYELQFNAGYYSFVYENLIKKDNNGKRLLTFGEVIERATENTNSNRFKLFKDTLNPSLAENYVLNFEYIKSNGEESDNIKCKVTDKPIKIKRDRKIDIGDEEIKVDKTVKTEYDIGHQIVESNLVLEMGENSFEVLRCEEFKDYIKNGNENAVKVLINPDLIELLKSKDHINLFRNMRFFEVANYTSGINNVMSFEDMSKEQEGAKYLSLIKGDIDNLGMIMAYGLSNDYKDLTGISRTTTLSNHLKYYFSFFMNGFLKFIDETGLKKNKTQSFNSSSYVIFAGGDDLMIVCPQTKSLELLTEFNAKFEEFVCKNPEVHISYSITNFNHSTPIRIVSDISEENQKEVKKPDKLNNDIKNNCNNIINNADSFLSEKNKATTYIFNTRVKNYGLNDLLNLKEQYYGWHEAEQQKISMGVIRNTLRLTEIMKEWREKEDTSKLIWHPYLSYMINRLLKKDGKYKDDEIGKLYDEILSINKSKEGKNLKETILYPALCEVIYKLRK